MPRRGENVYKRKDGRWEGRVLQPNGKYQYVYAKTYKEVKEKKKLLQNCKKRSVPFETGSVTTAADAFMAWLNGEVLCRVKPSTYESYYRCITKYVISFHLEPGYERITVQTAAEFMRSISGNPGLSVAYKRKILTIYRTALRELLRGAGELEAVLNVVSIPKAERADVQVFSLKEQRLVERVIIESPNQELLGVLLCFYTGIRLGEVCGLKWGDIDFDAGAMVVSRTVSRIKNFDGDEKKTSLCVGMPKSFCSVRKIPVPGFLLDRARSLKMDTIDEDCFVLSGQEHPIEPRKYQKLFQKTLKLADVKPRKFHAIRHTFATRALELGVDVKTLSEILGHANASITLNIYAHSMFEQKRKAIEQLNAMYLSHTPSTPFAVATPVIAT